ncbi:hypothetical protein [Bacillus sp. FJAT-29937]|uniref:hypothetical protein n=1 Tax=Bacillus sp. FJAT-29937 TaxID=1720553 RepID=UPI000836B8CA|nr:hypothetical protein [Bacillus sp. FJAT-29937]
MFFDIFVWFLMIVTVATLCFLYIAKKRMDNNEPVAGWKRKQFLEEQRQMESGDVVSQPTERTVKKNKIDKKEESLKDLIGIKDIRYGIFEKSKNEYSLIIATDYVNFDLLNTSEQQSIILGYQSLWKVINFRIQLLGQAVRQDLRKDEARFKKNLKNVNPQTRDYNERVIGYIKNRAVNDFRLTRKAYYLVSYIYEPSKMGKLTPEQKERRIAESLYQAATIVQKMLARAKITSEILDSLEGMEVLKRSLNRDRMLTHPIESVVEPGREKITSFITADPESLPGFEDLVQDLGEVMEEYEEFVPQEKEERIS